MNIEFDKPADALYITLKRGKTKKTIARAGNFLIDVDQKGNVLGIEILQYSKKILSAKDSSATALTKRKSYLPMTK